MKRAILLADAAEDDIEEASIWYSIRSRELERRYRYALSTTLDYLSEHPLGSTQIRGRIRQFPVKGFPFVVLFAVYPKVILVGRVFHTRQDPKRKLRTSR
ncbi:MAG TPA: type II toxin-antitoxin system RelE/ParE family toxin [Flavobacteriales bacterium]|nr:type II toxin-antitoxin system RelE/ParE family toxin [Flavobacteriales bacterium]